MSFIEQIFTRYETFAVPRKKLYSSLLDFISFSQVHKCRSNEECYVCFIFETLPGHVLTYEINASTHIERSP